MEECGYSDTYCHRDTNSYNKTHSQSHIEYINNIQYNKQTHCKSHTDYNTIHIRSTKHTHSSSSIRSHNFTINITRSEVNKQHTEVEKQRGDGQSYRRIGVSSNHRRISLYTIQEEFEMEHIPEDINLDRRQLYPIPEEG